MKRRMRIWGVGLTAAVAVCLVLGAIGGMPAVSMLALFPTVWLAALFFHTDMANKDACGRIIDDNAQESRTEARSALLSEWVSGSSMKQEEVVQRLRSVGIEADVSARVFPWELRIDGYAVHLAGHGIQYMRAMQRMLLEACEKTFPDALCGVTREDTVMMLHFSETLQHAQERSEGIRVIREAMASQYGITLTIGIGTSASSAQGIADAARSASSAIRYRMVFGPGQTIAFGDVQMRIGICPPYSKEHEAAILDAMRKCDAVKLEMHMSEFFEAVCAQSVRFIEPSAMRLLVSMYMSLPRQRQQESDFAKTCACLRQCEHYAEMLQVIKQYALHNMHPNETIRKEDQSEATLARIRAFVSDNVGNPDMSLTTIAENVGISATVIRALLKERLGTTPRDLIQNARMRQAQALLRDTELTAKAIGEMVGYRESRYFYNVFKKHSGMTTYEYRIWARSTEKKGPEDSAKR